MNNSKLIVIDILFMQNDKSNDITIWFISSIQKLTFKILFIQLPLIIYTN